MNLSPGQLKPLWRLLDAAWKAHSAAQHLDMRSTKAKEQWRHALLHRVLGVYSLKEVRRSGGQYAQLMAALEEIAGDGIHWQMQLHGADVRPLLHAFNALVEEYDLDQNWVCGVIRRALKLEAVPRLDTLTPAQLLTILQILRTHVAKHHRREKASPCFSSES